MEALLSLLVGALAAAGVWLMLARSLLRLIFGVGLLGTSANLAIFAAGRVGGATPPLIADVAIRPFEGAANALPQALILTAIVIGFGLVAFALSLALAAHRRLGTDDPDAMRVAEPEEGTR